MYICNKQESFIKKENGDLYNHISRNSESYRINVNLLIDNIKNIFAQLETYINFSNASLKLKNIYLKIYSNLLQKYFEEDKDSIAFNNSTFEFQNIFILMSYKFNELIVKYNNMINEKGIINNGNIQTKFLYDTQKNINDYISMNFELTNIQKDLLLIVSEIKQKINKNENTINLIKLELAKNRKINNTLNKYGLMVNENENGLINNENLLKQRFDNVINDNK